MKGEPVRAAWWLFLVCGAAPLATSAAAEERPREITAEELQRLWDHTEGLELMKKLPPGRYRVSGAVSRVDKSSVYLRSGKPDKEVSLELAPDQAKKRATVKLKATISATCEFKGHSFGGYVTMEQCVL